MKKRSSLVVLGENMLSVTAAADDLFSGTLRRSADSCCFLHSDLHDL
jgi:hypothetical protein